MRKTSIVEPSPIVFRRPQTDVNIAIRSDVILGSPSARCNGVGICRVMGIGANPDCPCDRVTATLSLMPDGAVKFTFDKNDLTQGQRKVHFQWGLFNVVESYRVPARICKELGWKSGWIYPGTYQVWETASTFSVVFNNRVNQQVQ